YQCSEDNYKKGLGLGLTIVGHLVDIQGGKIKVDSTLGKGSIFSFSLPIYRDLLEESKVIEDKYAANENNEESKITLQKTPIIEKELYNEGRYTVLIVEDEISNQKVMVDIVSEMGLNIIIADNGND